MQKVNHPSLLYEIYQQVTLYRLLFTTITIPINIHSTIKPRFPYLLVKLVSTPISPPTQKHLKVLNKLIKIDGVLVTGSKFVTIWNTLVANSHKMR